MTCRVRRASAFPRSDFLPVSIVLRSVPALMAEKGGADQQPASLNLGSRHVKRPNLSRP